MLPIGHHAGSIARKAALVVVLAFAMSTQILFSPTIFADFSPVEIFEGWLEQFLDALAVSTSMLAAVLAAKACVAEKRWWQPSVLAAAATLAAALAMAVLTAIHYPAGYFPSAVQLAGDTLRFAIPGAIIAVVWAVQNRGARAERELLRMELDRVALNRRMLEAQLQVMEAQIEPHFLFNTLATVKRLYRSEPKGGERMLERLRHYLGHALPRIRGDTTTIGSEFELVRAYLDVLQVRMGARLAFHVEAPDSIVREPFPPMMLLTLVENSIKHGLGPLPEGGRIDVEARVAGGVVRVRVADDGAGFQGASGSGIGLANIRSRLAALYGGRAGLTLEANQPRGVVSAIEVPLAVEGAA
jgi:signal transduction histidine kinase